MSNNSDEDMSNFWKLCHYRLTTVQALGLMSVREAGCGREARGWVYSGYATYFCTTTYLSRHKLTLI